MLKNALLACKSLLTNWPVKQWELMYYGSGTVHRIASGSHRYYAYAAVRVEQTHCHQMAKCVCSTRTDGSTFPHEMTSWPPSWKYDVISKIPTLNWCNFVKISSRSDFECGTSAFFEEVTPNKRKRTKRTRWVAIWDQFLIQKSKVMLIVIIMWY